MTTEDIYIINKKCSQDNLKDGLKNCFSTSMIILNEEKSETHQINNENQQQESLQHQLRLNSTSLYSGDDDSSSIFYETNSKALTNNEKRHPSSNDYNSRKELLQQSGTNSNISVSNCFSTNSENNQNLNVKMTNSNEDLLFKEQEKVVLIDFRENNLATTYTYRDGSTLNNQLDNNANNDNPNADASSAQSDKNKKIIVRVVTVVSAIFFIVCFAMVAFTLRYLKYFFRLSFRENSINTVMSAPFNHPIFS